MKCPECRGRGYHPPANKWDSGGDPCGTCDGLGFIEIENGELKMAECNKVFGGVDVRAELGRFLTAGAFYNDSDMSNEKAFDFIEDAFANYLAGGGDGKFNDFLKKLHPGYELIYYTDRPEERHALHFRKMDSAEKEKKKEILDMAARMGAASGRRFLELELMKIPPNNPAAEFLKRFEYSRSTTVSSFPRMYGKTTYYESKVVEMFLQSFAAIQSWVHDNAVKHGQRDTERNDGEIIALIHAELSEALEALRNGNPADSHISEFNGAEAELADVILWIMGYAEMRGWRVAEAVIAKLRYNEKRPYKHGGKKF